MFDPVSWAIGYAATAAAKKVAQTLFANDARSRLEDVVEQWCANLPDEAKCHPQALFPQYAKDDSGDRVAVKRVAAKLGTGEMPSVEEWTEALVERWRVVAASPDGNTTFFHLSETQAASYLQKLAKRIHTQCAREIELALPHLVNAVDAVHGELHAVREELGHVRMNLDRVFTTPAALPRADPQAVERIARAVVAAGNRAGWPNCTVQRSESRDGLSLNCMWERLGRIACAVFDPSRLAMLTALDASLLDSTVAGALAGVPLFEGVSESWNELVPYVGQVATTLYPDSVRDGNYAISARPDLGWRIGVPFPASVEATPTDADVGDLRLEEQMVPVLYFDESELRAAIGVPELEASAGIAARLLDRSGPPTYSQ